MSENSASPVVFDLDGTLLDHARSSRTAVLVWARKTHPRSERTAEDVVVEWKRLEDEHFPLFTERVITFEEQRARRIRSMDAFMDPCIGAEEHSTFDDYLQQYEAAWTAYSDVTSALEALSRRGHPLYVFTNGQRGQQERKIQALGLSHLVRDLVASSELSASKPSPRAFEEAWERLGLRPTSGHYVGDDLTVDVLGANAAGIKPIWLDREHRAGDHPGRRVTSLLEVEQLLDG